MMDMKIKVYISCPLTSSGRVTENVHNALEAANKLLDAGFAVYVPHWNVIQDMAFPRGYDFWLAHDLEWLTACNILLRLPGDSSGADVEVQKARELGKPVWFDVDRLIEAAKRDDARG
jgi:hypothetical protein